MSRIGKKPITIPDGVEVKLDQRILTVKGPKGQLSREIPATIAIEIAEKEVNVTASGEDKFSRSLWGTMRMHVSNMVEGVSKGFIKQLQIEGIGYRASVEGENLVLQVGYTHPVKISAEKDIKFTVEKNIVTVSGINKEIVTKIAALTKRVRPPEPYKGKGIRYVGEKIRRKVGKKTAAGK
ncbi:MAG TPA: 50S ribosomal protein L6 [Candidatus Paceibacterota bacterium]|nr:50S ribosomal protein L6 [Candidatus Pacearchaeota archaeon]HRZ50962.1 50S ribosomal protein L6 [Candidatus Paceibacterota bacterium]HSA36683.1 50S ribosomal protein L6 [Candidatus Paceibacterota bacterium]